MKYDGKKIKEFRMLLTKILDFDRTIKELSKKDKKTSLFIEAFRKASPEEQQRILKLYDNYRDE